MGSIFSVRPNKTEDVNVKRAFRLGKQPLESDVIIDVADTVHGVLCDCPDFVFRRDGLAPAWMLARAGNEGCRAALEGGHPNGRNSQRQPRCPDGESGHDNRRSSDHDNRWKPWFAHGRISGGLFSLLLIVVPFPVISRSWNGERTIDLAQTLIFHGTSLCVEPQRS
jgi:hypothetical protein